MNTFTATWWSHSLKFYKYSIEAESKGQAYRIAVQKYNAEAPVITKKGDPPSGTSVYHIK